MAKFNVVMASKNRSYSFKGKEGQDVEMVEYQVALTDEGGAQKMGMMSRSAKKDAPNNGDELQGHWEETEKFGWQFKEDRQGGASGGRGGYGGKSQEERNEIMAEKAVAEANLFMTAKANFMLELLKVDLADPKELKAIKDNFNSAGLMQVASALFAQYKKMSVVEEPKAATPPPAEPDADNTPENVNPTPGIMPNGKPEEVVDPKDIPF